MKAATDTENWRNKYFDTLSSLESETRQFRAMEATLKRLVGRLCIASQGQSPRLDEELKKLQAAIRREASSSELDQITPTLTDAINTLDHAGTEPPGVAAQPIKARSNPPPEIIMSDDRVRATLATLLIELRRDPELINQVEVLESGLAIPMTHEQLPEVLSAITAIVGQRIEHIEHAKREIEVLLGQMVGKLDEISQFVVEQNHNQSESLASNESLNTQLVSEMKAIGESVESTAGLQQIRTQVRSRLDSIDRHLQEFQQRETTRANAMRTRNEAMQSRVAQLEAEANRLHSQLKDEQRLSLIDALTQVPNRLAYEKRIEEELQRWRHFGQPTCIAAWDIDYFKRINDTCGHRGGDRVLRAVAECLTTRIRGTDFIARYGGEEFVMILAGTKLDDAVRLIDATRSAIAKLVFHFRGAPVPVTISCGVTALLTGDSAGAAFNRADKALYQAKDAGRNRCISI